MILDVCWIFVRSLKRFKYFFVIFSFSLPQADSFNSLSTLQVLKYLLMLCALTKKNIRWTFFKNISFYLRVLPWNTAKPSTVEKNWLLRFKIYFLIVRSGLLIDYWILEIISFPDLKPFPKETRRRRGDFSQDTVQRDYCQPKTVWIFFPHVKRIWLHTLYGTMLTLSRTALSQC